MVREAMLCIKTFGIYRVYVIAIRCTYGKVGREHTMGVRLVFRAMIGILLVLGIPVTPGFAQLPSNSSMAPPDATAPFIDRGLVMGGCGVGVAVGALSVATYPIWKWAKDAGALVSMGAVTWRSLLGCYYGLIAGFLYSGANSTARMVGTAFGGGR